MMEAARTSETLVNFYQTTRRYNKKTTIFVLTAVRTSNPTIMKLKFVFCSHNLPSSVQHCTVERSGGLALFPLLRWLITKKCQDDSGVGSTSPVGGAKMILLSQLDAVGLNRSRSTTQHFSFAKAHFVSCFVGSYSKESTQLCIEDVNILIYPPHYWSNHLL
jgi:hypothetical protein